MIPIGDTVTLQVIADGFQTYGQVYKIDKLKMAMEVRLNRPVPQYSIYKNSAGNSEPGNGSGSGNDTGSDNHSGSGKSSGSTPNSPPPDSGSKPSDPPPNPSPSQPPPK